jgi:hypothetical protein
MPNEPKGRLLDRFGVIAGIAGVLVAIAAIIYSHRERVYVSVSPTMWESLGLIQVPTRS